MINKCGLLAAKSLSIQESYKVKKKYLFKINVLTDDSCMPSACCIPYHCRIFNIYSNCCSHCHWSFEGSRNICNSDNLLKHITSIHSQLSATACHICQKHNWHLLTCKSTNRCHNMDDICQQWPVKIFDIQRTIICIKMTCMTSATTTCASVS